MLGKILKKLSDNSFFRGVILIELSVKNLTPSFSRHTPLHSDEIVLI